ncbi:hypothetical protein BD809_10457 [Aquimarina intermedia]|uniref:Lipoprotein n=1 Tax=Aquimarina intermedia TaxID=350814 RepID=A0A5S5C530_9FLAO|nr:hypothetical protein BD809_10457 [Aquimarina intermedia]
MKKLITVFAVGALFISCEKSELNEETSEINEYEIYQVDKNRVSRPKG